MDSRQAFPASPGQMIGNIILALIFGTLLPLIAVLQISMLSPVLMLCGILAVHMKAKVGWVPTILLFTAALSSTLWFVSAPIMFMVLLAAVLPSLYVMRGVAGKKPFFEQLRASIAAYALGLVAAMLVAYATYGGGMIAQFVDVLRSEFARMPDAALQPFADAINSALAINGINQMGAFTVQMYRQQLTGILDLMQQTYARMLPGALLSGALLSGVLSALWGNWTMARRGMATNESFIGMSQWFLPGQISLGAIALLGIGFLLANSQYDAGKSVYDTVGELTGVIFSIQAIAAVDRRMVAGGTRLSRRKVLIALLSIGALFFGGIATMLSIVGMLSALFGSHGAIRLWLNRRQNDHSDHDDPDL